MSDADPVRGFVAEVLSDLGADLSEHDGILWVTAAEGLQRALEVPRHVALAFDPVAADASRAELVAPGSFLLERILALATARGRWDVGRVAVASPAWARDALSGAGLPRAWVERASVEDLGEEPFVCFTFRVTLTSDAKRETYHAILVSRQDAWEVLPEEAEVPLVPVTIPPSLVDLHAGYDLARRFLAARLLESLEAFRRESIAALDEEVRRIFAYFDGTVREIRAASAEVARELIAAVEGERDRRLAEALERFEPHATAALCGVRVVLAPRAVARSGTTADPAVVEIDAFARRARGLRCSRCGNVDGPWSADSLGRITCAGCTPTGAASARPRGHPRSGIPRRRTTAGRAAARSPRGSKERSRFDGATRRGA